MLVVRVELWPGGDYRRANTIATMIVGNQSALADTSDYSVRATENGAPHLGILPSESEFLIKDHPRKQSVWELIAKAANTAAAIARGVSNGP
jgi:hypothetical protein